MKKNQVNTIFNEDLKRKKKIASFLVLIFVLFAVSLAFLFKYINVNKVQYVKYNEFSDVEYQVFLKDNTFYHDHSIEKNRQYISELVDYIDANFSYQLDAERDNLEYKYSYRIEAEVTVQDKTTKRNIYEYSDVLIPANEISTKEQSLSIHENVTIDYNKYNDLILDFVNTYKLDETESLLSIKMIVDVDGSCEDFSSNTTNESITSLDIPLTHRTVAIDITNNLINNLDKIMICSKSSPFNYLYLFIFIILVLFDFVLFVLLIHYIRSSRSAKTVYEIELKKILSNYRSYIQKVNSKFDLTGYQPLKVDNFTDMLEIRDTTSKPILLVEDGSKNGAYFIIPTDSKLLYIYGIKVSDYEKEPKSE